MNKSKNETTQRSFASDENARPAMKSQDKGRAASKSRNHNQLEQLHYVMQETDNSMEELLNSSINQFEKLIIHE